MFENHYIYQPYDKYMITDEWIDFPEDSNYIVNKIVSEIYWGVAREVSIRLTFPIIFSKFGDEENSGLGDAIFSLLYQPLRSEDEESVGVVLWAGARFPTGDYKKFPPLGDGSYDFLISIYSVSDFYGALNYSTIGLWLNGNDHEGNSIPEEYVYNMALQIPILKNHKPFVNIMGELDGYFMDGFGFDETNGHQACLGLQYVEIKNLVIEGSVAVPIWKRGGHKYPYSPVFGVIFSF